MKRLILATLIAGLAATTIAAAAKRACWLEADSVTADNVRTCIYRCLNGPTFVAVLSWEACPLSVQR